MAEYRIIILSPESSQLFRILEFADAINSIGNLFGLIVKITLGESLVHGYLKFSIQ